MKLKAPEMDLLLHTTPEFKVKIVPGCYAVQMRGRGWEWEAGGGRMGTSKSSAADQGWG